MKKLKSSRGSGKIHYLKPSSDFLKREIEENLIHLLATYIFLRRKDPINVLLNDLHELEVQSGRLLNAALKDNSFANIVHGSFSRVLCLVPISGND